MICPKCGMENNQYASFCIRCGVSFMSPTEQQTSPLLETVVPTGVQPITSLNVNETGIKRIKPILVLFSAMIKPHTVFKDELQKIKGLKDSLIIACLVLFLGILSSLCVTVFNSVNVSSYDVSKGKAKTAFVWDKVSNVDYIKVIGNDLLQLAVVITVIIVVCYIVAIIMKKRPNFNKVLVIITSSLMPYILFSFVSPFLGLLYMPIQLLVFIIGVLFSFIILYELLNDEIGFEGNLKVFYNLICFSVLVSVYYIYIVAKFKFLLGDIVSF